MDDYRDLAFKDFFNGAARDFVRNRILESGDGVTEDSYDSFGANIEAATDTGLFFLFMYKFYFRVEAHGVENLPAEGSGIVVANHAPILPFDACMIYTAALNATEKPRQIRTIINKGISAIPYASIFMARNGQVIGCDENVKRILDNKRLVLVFPTGAEGDIHTIFDKYHLDEFPVGFMEHALRYRAPIIPTCVTGSEEAAMTLGKIETKLMGFKHLPLTPIFPWFGLLGLIPFPSKFDIYFGAPVDYHTEHAKDADNPKIVRELVEDLRSKIRAMLDEALAK